MVDDLNDQTGTIDGDIGLSEGFDDTFTSACGWTQVDKQDLVMSVIDDLRQFLFTADQIGIIQLAFEHGVLQVIAPVSK
jgi:hypothetical protein